MRAPLQALRSLQRRVRDGTVLPSLGPRFEPHVRSPAQQILGARPHVGQTPALYPSRHRALRSKRQRLAPVTEDPVVGVGVGTLGTLGTPGTPGP